MNDEIWPIHFAQIANESNTTHNAHKMISQYLRSGILSNVMTFAFISLLLDCGVDSHKQLATLSVRYVKQAISVSQWFLGVVGYNGC